MSELTEILDSYTPSSTQERVDVARVRAALDHDDVFSRSTPLHVTASAFVVHLPTQRVLLRWHTKMHRWMQVGGHFDPGETSPRAVALREATEETGLTDLELLGDATRGPIQIVIVPVPANGEESAHEHADIRYVFTTRHPEDAEPETAAAKLRWLPVATASTEIEEENQRVFLLRTQAVIDENMTS